MSIKSAVKGLIGEAIGSIAHKIMLDRTIYRELNNVTIPTHDGTTQIDHILVSRYGIFVVESKNMGGWIFGNEKSAQWTQSFFGRKYKFQNPLRQNYRHTKCLAKFLGLEHNKIHSIVMFWGDSTFKTPMPENVLDTSYSSYIKSKREIYFSDGEVEDIVQAIQTGRLPRTWTTRKSHIKSLQTRHARQSKSQAQSNASPTKSLNEALGMVTKKASVDMPLPIASGPYCPQCGSSMVKLSGKRSNAWSCSRFPDCEGLISS